MTKEKNSIFNRILSGIERIGNKLPHPITLFAIFCVIIIALSAILSMMGISATGEFVDRAAHTWRFKRSPCKAY